MLIGYEGKSRLRTVRPTDAAVTRCNLNCNIISKIIQGWSTVIWSWIMGMKCPFIMDADCHYVVKCGILVVDQDIRRQDIHDRSV